MKRSKLTDGNVERSGQRRPRQTEINTVKNDLLELTSLVCETAWNEVTVAAADSRQQRSQRVCSTRHGCRIYQFDVEVKRFVNY